MVVAHEQREMSFIPALPKGLLTCTGDGTITTGSVAKPIVAKSMLKYYD